MLLNAAKQEDETIFNLLVKAGVDLNQRNYNEETALFIASKSGDVLAVQRLVSAKADVCAASLTKWCTPLHAAQKNRFNNIVKLLRKAGAGKCKCRGLCFQRKWTVN